MAGRAASPRILVAMHRYGQSYLHLPALLAGTGFPVDAVATRGHPLRRARAFAEVEEAGPGEWAAAIDRRLAGGRYGWFCNVDEPGLVALYRHPWSAASVDLLPFPPGSPVAATVGSKEAFHAWCAREGLPVPTTFACSGPAEVEALRPGLDGDWWIKGDLGSGGQQVTRWPSPRVNAVPSSVRAASGRLLVQEDVGPGVGAALFLAERGRLLAWFGVRKVACLNGGRGPTVRGRGDPDPRVGELCAALAAASGVTGLTGFDYVTCPRRGPLLIDSHLGRTTTMNHVDRLQGVDFAAVLASVLRGEPTVAPPPVRGPDFIKFPELLELGIREGWAPFRAAAAGPARVPLAPPGDLLLAARVTAGVVVGSLRVRLGAARRSLGRGR